MTVIVTTTVLTTMAIVTATTHRNGSPANRKATATRGDRHEYCRANLRHARVDLDQQLSRTQCRYGDNWGYDNGGVWVEDGCRAVFSVY